MLQTISRYYVSKDTATKQRIVSSMFPEKLIFENNSYRTPKINSVVSLMCRTNEASKGNKKGKDNFFNYPSLGVVSLGIEPRSKV